MDQSTLADRVSLNETRYVQVHETGLRLADMDEAIKERSADMHEKISYEVQKFKEEFEHLKKDNATSIQNHKVLIKMSQDDIKKHREDINDNKSLLS